jgi:hypothetical protein
MNVACGMYEREKKRMQGFGGNTLRKEITWKSEM